MTETPIYDELEEKWEEETYFKAICDVYWTVTNNATGQTWLEDDEGNEVFIEEREFSEEPQTDYREPIQTDILPEGHGSESHVGTCGIVDCNTKRHKRKFKLLGRNQHCQGTL